MRDGELKGFRPAIAIAVAIATGIAIAFHKWSLNADGPHWSLDWQNLRGSEVFPWLLLGAMPLVAALFAWPRWRKSAITLLMLSSMAMQFLGVCVRSDPFSLRPIVRIVQSRGAISYYIAAEQLEEGGIRQGLKNYSQLMPTFPIHGREKPPGPVLYYYLFINLFGDGSAAAIASAIGIVLFTSIAIPTTYLMSRTIVEDGDAAFHAAVCVCLAPAMVIFFPAFDPCYVAILCLMFLTWDRWLLTGNTWYAISFGAIIFAVTFWAYNPLVTGTFLLAMSIFRWIYNGRFVAARILPGAAIAAGILIGIYAALYPATNFNPISTFHTALHEQAKADEHLGRTYLNTIPTNALGFMIGMGPSLVIVALMALLGDSRHCAGRRGAAAMLIGLGQIAIVAASGLLKGETDRVWMFLCPLVAIPAGWEISRWPPRWRAAFYAASWFLAVECLQNMKTAWFHF